MKNVRFCRFISYSEPTWLRKTNFLHPIVPLRLSLADSSIVRRNPENFNWIIGHDHWSLIKPWKKVLKPNILSGSFLRNIQRSIIHFSCFGNFTVACSMNRTFYTIHLYPIENQNQYTLFYWGTRQNCLRGAPNWFIFWRGEHNLANWKRISLTEYPVLRTDEYFKNIDKEFKNITFGNMRVDDPGLSAECRFWCIYQLWTMFEETDSSSHPWNLWGCAR